MINETMVQSVIENRVAEVCIRVDNYQKVEPFYKDFLGPASRDTGVTVSDIVTHGNGQRQFNITDPEGNILTLIKSGQRAVLIEKSAYFPK